MNGAPALKLWMDRFDDPALGSSQTFRAILAAMEHPGRIITIRENPYPPHVLNSASAATCLFARASRGRQFSRIQISRSGKN